MRNVTMSTAVVTLLLAMVAAQARGAGEDGDGAQPPAPSADGAPSATDAKERLERSPRHGEWVDVPPAGGPALKTFVVYPERSTKAPVVIVIHEIFGLTEWIRAVADRLAEDGYIAVAPDLLSGMGPGGGGTEALGERVTETIRTLTPDDVTARLNAVRDYALKIAAADGSVAVMGFCWGGAMSVEYALRQPALAAAVSYYGSLPTAPGAYANAKVPILGLYGSEDARVNTTIAPAQAAMKEAGVHYEPVIYEGAGHGFLRQQNEAGSPNMNAARQAWPKTLAFLKEHAS